MTIDIGTYRTRSGKRAHVAYRIAGVWIGHVVEEDGSITPGAWTPHGRWQVLTMRDNDLAAAL